ncbi:MAG TPA: QueT transporter family protein [Bacilli bacterium]|nr:QueT transporter family protein [Bacilli bacterium]
MKERNRIHQIIRLAIITALYVTLTIVLSFMSFGDIQFRIAEVLLFLCFFRKDYGIALILGCAIANFFSPLGIIDVVFGTLATAISVFLIMKSKNIFIASLFPVVFNAVLVGLELHLVLGLPLLVSMATVAIGEAVVVVVLGNLIFFKLRKNTSFLELIEATQNC